MGLGFVVVTSHKWLCNTFTPFIQFIQVSDRSECPLIALLNTLPCFSFKRVSGVQEQVFRLAFLQNVVGRIIKLIFSLEIFVDIKAASGM